MMESPIDSQGFMFRPSALAFGMTDAQLRRAASKTKSLARLGPGIYARRPGEKIFPEEWHRLVAIAISSENAYAATRAPTARRPVLSFQSAAAVHRMAVLDASYDYVHFTTQRGSGNVRYLRHTHPGPLAADEITEVDGVLVTTLERTAVDVACQGSFAAALAAFDSALRMGADRAVMSEILNRQRRRGARNAKSALSHANPLAENVGESWSRAQMIKAGLPSPVLQKGFVVEGHQFYVDFLLPNNVVGEFDGIKKYTKLVREGQESSDVVIEEKLREELLRSIGLDVVRWIWDDLRNNVMVPRVMSTLNRAALTPSAVPLR